MTTQERCLAEIYGVFEVVLQRHRGSNAVEVLTIRQKIGWDSKFSRLPKCNLRRLKFASQKFYLART